MAGLTPIRRVVTGNDERGQSKVVWDGPAPNAHAASMGLARGHTDLWVWNDTPAPLSGDSDDGNHNYVFPGPTNGGHLRVVQGPPKPADYDPAKDKDAVAPHPSKLGPADRTSGTAAATSASRPRCTRPRPSTTGSCSRASATWCWTIATLVMKPGDIVVQVGAWHQWHFPKGAQMAFDMFAARFVDGPKGLGQGNDKPITTAPKLPAGVKPARRIVTIDREPGIGTLVCDGPAPDVRTDPARPGICVRAAVGHRRPPGEDRVRNAAPASHDRAAAEGSVCRVVTIPPDDAWKGKVGSAEVQAYFRAMGSPGASTYSPQAPHPYMQKTRTLEFGIVLEGEIALVLDTQEVRLKAGDIVILRGSNHAWSNRSANPAVVAVCSHDGK